MGSVKDFRSARTLEEALSWLSELGAEAQVLAGGTDVMIQYLRGEITPSVLLHIERLEDLRGITRNQRVHIGPLTTHFTLATDATINEQFPATSEAARTVGGWQTQVVGTVGGNLCNASPAADLAPPLLVADAAVTLSSVTGEREMPLTDFLVGRRETARDPDELLTDISLEPPGERTGEIYLKLGRRAAMEVAIVGMAVRLSFDSDAVVTRARLSLCSVAPRPYRATQAEQALSGSRLEPEVVREAGRLLAASASPIDDVRSGADYRIATLPRLLGKAVQACLRRAGFGE